MRFCSFGFWRGISVITAALLAVGTGVFQVSEPRAENAAAGPTFEPGDISIGEPIALPFAGPRPDPAASAVAPHVAPQTDQPFPAPRSPTGSAQGLNQLTPIGPRPVPPQAVLPPSSAAAAGQGWLGLAVAESSVPGRWIVDTVAPVGPAAAAGILPGDEVRGINGLPLRNADEVSQALTAIAPGQPVGLAIARGEQVRDVQLIAAARPAAAPFAATAPLTASIPDPTPGAGPPAAFSPPAPPAVITTPPAAVPAHPITPPSFDAGSPRPAGAAGELPATRFGGMRDGSAISSTRRDQSPQAEPAIAAPFDHDPQAPSSPAGSGGRTALGVRTLPIDDGLQARFQLPAASGAYVLGVIQDLPASKAGVPPGSVIVSLDDRPVRSPEELTRLVTNGPVGRPVSLEYILPGGTPQRAEVVLQNLEQPLVEALVGAPEPQSSGIPVLQPGPSPTTARRPPLSLGGEATAAMRIEIDWLRARLRLLEQRLDAVTP